MESFEREHGSSVSILRSHLQEPLSHLCDERTILALSVSAGSARSPIIPLTALAALPKISLADWWKLELRSLTSVSWFETT